MKKDLLIMAAAMTLAGSGIPVSKFLAEELPVFTANWLSLLCAVPVLLLPGIAGLKGLNLQRLPLQDVAKIFAFPALQGFFGMALFRVLMFYGLQRLPAVECGLLTASAPCIMAVMAFVFLGERMRPLGILAVFLAVAGVFFIQFNAVQVHFSVSGSLFVFAAIICECLLTLIRKSARVYIPPAANTLLIVSFCLVYLLPAVLLEGGISAAASLSAGQIAGCVYMGVMVTALAYICWGYASTKIPAGVTGIITGMMPLTGAVLSVLVLKEPFSLRYLLGGGCIFASFILCTRTRTAISSGRSSCPEPSESVYAAGEKRG